MHRTAAAALITAVLAAPLSAQSQPASVASTVRTGLDLLFARRLADVPELRLAVVCNHSARDGAGRHLVDRLIAEFPGRLRAILSPEHGFTGTADEKIASSRHPRTGLPIHSLYGETRRPAPEMLAEIDALVFDIQDAGARFYTYITTLAYCLEAATERGIPIVVLDRPNPIGGHVVEGPGLDAGIRTFIACHDLPVRHGLTVGELARLFNEERRIGAKLRIIAMEGWGRRDWFDDTGLLWVDPSPNLRNPAEATLYPGIGCLESTDISVGRGTDTPFLVLGAPWMDGRALAARLRARAVPGVGFVPIEFTPRSSRHAGKLCQGVHLNLLDREALRPVRLGLEIACALHALHPVEFSSDAYAKMLGCAAVAGRIRAGETAEAIARSFEANEKAFLARRRPFLLYE